MSQKTKTRKVRCDNCDEITDIEAIHRLETVADLNLRLDPGSEVPAGECPDCGALCYLVKLTPTPALLDVAKRVFGIIELTYRHDDDGNRLIDEPGKYSGADVVEWLLELEDDLAAAITAATQPPPEHQRIIINVQDGLVEHVDLPPHLRGAVSVEIHDYDTEGSDEINELDRDEDDKPYFCTVHE